MHSSQLYERHGTWSEHSILLSVFNIVLCILGAFWIGVNDLEKDGNWVLTGSGGVPEYYNWMEGYPENNDDSKNCVIINPSGEWSCINCPAVLAYVCEKSA